VSDEEGAVLFQDAMTKEALGAFQAEFEKQLMFGDSALPTGCLICRQFKKGIVDKVCPDCRTKAVELAVKKRNLKFVE
jgi:hypothetical protein